MGHFTTPFIEETRQYVIEFIADHFSEQICYHNIDHTLDVVEATEIIGRACNISDADLEMLLIAAWFHDTGYYLGCRNHEETSAEIAKNFLTLKGKDRKFIGNVINCILATKVPQSPRNLFEQIICDADLYHLATEKFFEKSELLWQEFSHNDKNMTPLRWLNQSKEFVSSHRYHTVYGKNELFPKLKKNLKKLNAKINSQNQ